MNYWGYIIKSVSERILARDCGYETEAEAEEAAKIMLAKIDEVGAEISVEQVWQELNYIVPTQVVYSDVEYGNGVIVLAGIAYHDEVINMLDGKAVPLPAVQIIDELPWINFSEELIGDEREKYSEYGEVI